MGKLKSCGVGQGGYDMRRGSNDCGEVGMKKATKQWVENDEKVGVCALSNVSLDLGCRNRDTTMTLPSHRGTSPSA